MELSHDFVAFMYLLKKKKFQMMEPKKYSLKLKCVFGFTKCYFSCFVKNKFACWWQKVYNTKTDKSRNINGYDAIKLRKLFEFWS